ncbi:hypothetical protein V5P93_006150 [Actinokineospora auranticolor]|uniref:Uncharacterized protein n=1 Tax=Actinokineospora auranticolor TaxID=155976 RepID=A0A2S6GGC5_9PSEU|nr:hypothetical protein [Actinokineospora auranticolor]PPK64241.1 hypothetical protein CLV40_121105 [Actinokineospora auranticolor]
MIEQNPEKPEPADIATKKRRRFNGGVLVITALLVGFLLGGAAFGGRKAGTDPAGSGDAAEVLVAATTAATPTPDPLPKPGDFTVAVNVLEKHCFGAAGCNITYRVEPAYTGSTPLPEGQEFTVVYEMNGGDEPQIGHFTISGKVANFSSQEMIQTTSSKAELTAKVTGVL